MKNTYKIRIIKRIVGVILILFCLFVFVSGSEPCRTHYTGFPGEPSCSFFNHQGLQDFGIVLLGLTGVSLLAVTIVWLFGGLD